MSSSADSEIISEDAETRAFTSFKTSFEKLHKNIDFGTCHLKTLINDSNNGVFAIFLHKPDDVFSQYFSNLLSQKLVNNLNLLVWDVSLTSINSVLLKNLREILDFEKLIPSSLHKASGLFLFSVVDNEVKTIGRFKDDFKECELVAEISRITDLPQSIFFKDDYCNTQIHNLESFGLKIEFDLKLAIEKCFLEEKPLLVYLHNMDHFFSQTFCDILSNTDANHLINKFIFYPYDLHKSDDVIKKLYKQGFTFLEDLFENVYIEKSAIFIFKQVVKKDVVTDCLKGNVTQQTLLTDLYRIYQNFEKDKESALFEVEKESVLISVKNFKLIFSKDIFSFFEKDSLNNAFEKHVFVQPNYLRKVLIICLYDLNDMACVNFFSNMIDDKKVKKLLYSMYHVLLWNVNDEKLSKTLKYLNSIHFDDKDMARKIENIEGGLFFVEAHKKKAEIIFKRDMKDLDLETLICTLNFFGKDIVEKYDATDLVEIEAAEKFISQKLVENKYRSIFEHLPIQKIISKKCTRKNVLKRKMLLLHLQNESSENPFLTALPTNYEVLKKHYCVIAWDISDPKIAEKLILANERYFRCGKITEALKNKKSETFIFIPTTNTMAFAGDFTNFAAITDMFIKENLNFGFDISPFVFQENLCKQLSDRDYNHFNLDKEEDEAFFRDWVSFAIFGNPSVEGQKYKEEQKNHITEVMTQIQAQVQRHSFNPKRLYVACVYICWIPLGKDFINHVSLPVIAVQKCLNSKSRSCRIYVDSNLRVYESWVGYLSENNLAPGIFIVPQDGVYQIDCFGRVRLECIYDKKIGTTVVNTLDKVSMFAGLGSAAVGVTTLLTSVALAPVVLTGAAAAGAAVGVYSLVRGGTHLYDRNQHHESMHFKNREARAAYLNLAAGVFSFATSGATATLSYFAQNGTEIGEISISFINLMCGANIAVNGVNISNCIYDVYFNWRVSGHRPDSLQIIQLMSSVLFFAHSVYNAKSANTIISESQAQKLYEIESNLTNKQKRVFNKMIKETIRTNEGNVQQGYREVISYINNVDNIQETLAILARNNKRLHQNNVRFAVADGQIRFNGVNVDLQTFDSLSNLKKMNYFTDLPKIPEVNIKHRMTTTKTINNYFNPSSLIHSATIIYKFGSELCSEDVSSVISRFSEVVANQFMIILRKFLEKASLDEFLNKNLISLAKSTPLEIIFDFFNLRGMRIARELINSVNPDLNEKLDNLLMCIEKAIMIATMDIERVIRELLKFAITWLAQKAYTTMVDSEKSTTEKDYGNNQGVVCDVCQGRHK